MFKIINILLIALSFQAIWWQRKKKMEFHKLEYFFHTAALMEAIPHS